MSQFQPPQQPWQPEQQPYYPPQQQWQQPPQSDTQWSQWQQPNYAQPQTYYPPQQPQYPPDPQQYYPPPTPPQRPPKQNHTARNTGGGTIIGLIVFIVILIMSHSASPSPTDTSSSQGTISQGAQQQSTTQANPTIVPTDSHPHFGDGTFQVGKDIQPGTYRTRVGSSGCYYARLSGFGGTLDEIIANGNTDDPAIVTIAATDKGFESQNCGTWTQNLSAITTSKTTFGGGMYIVGTDIEPGTYKNTGSRGCYYARLSGFSGSDGDIIANNNVDAVTIVTIAASDKGFESTSCGTWTKQ